MSLKTIEPPLQEKVIGVYSLPSSLRDNMRFARDGDGRLYLRIYDRAASEWRDATTDDLTPPIVDVAEARREARCRAYTRGSYSTVAQAERAILRQGTPAFIDADRSPQFSTVRVQTQANFFVTDGLPQIQGAPLLDWIETGGDYWKMWVKQVGRRGATLEG